MGVYKLYHIPSGDILESVSFSHPGVALQCVKELWLDSDLQFEHRSEIFYFIYGHSDIKKLNMDSTLTMFDAFEVTNVSDPLPDKR